MIHLILHAAVPMGVAIAFYRPAWRSAALLLLATMIVDVDHLLADPVYDPERCSLGFHPLHTAPALGAYLVLFGLPWIPVLRDRRPAPRSTLRVLHLVGLGLLIHMALDGVDCLL